MRISKIIITLALFVLGLTASESETDENVDLSDAGEIAHEPDKSEFLETKETFGLAEPEGAEPTKVSQVLRDFEESILEIHRNMSNSSEESAAEVSGQVDETDSEIDAAAKSKPRLNCLPVNRTRDNGIVDGNQVLVLNGTEFQLRLTEDNIANVTNRTFPGICSVTFFYASWCDFSASAASSFNAVPRYLRCYCPKISFNCLP